VKISGADPDFHRRDLWEAIESGNFPEWELSLQIFTEEQAASFPFDILDATKIVPEELVPLTPVGRMVLNRNPDNFFAETEQVAFCTAHIVPGIDFSNDPLLQGRNHSYLDTQISRLGGPNFHEIPINSPIVQVQNNQRDGMHRQAIHRGRVNYEPNSLGGGCPFQAGKMGFTSFPERFTTEDKVRGNPELFAEHYGQARLFYQSQTPAEQAHIANAFRFELTRVQTPAVRQRILALLGNVDTGLAAKVAEGLGMDVPEPLPRAFDGAVPEYPPSPSLSLLSRPGETGIRTRRVAILVAPGVDGAQVQDLYAGLLKGGAVPRLVGGMLGKVQTADGAKLDVEISLEAGPSVMYDGMIVPDGAAAADVLARNAHAIDFLREQYRHGKPILVLGGAANLLAKAMIPTALPDGSSDPALLVDGTLDAFETALAGHRAYARETDPPMV
jgi:catalase